MKKTNRILVLLLLLVLVLLLITNNTNIFTKISEDNLLVLTYDTDISNTNVQNLVKLLDKNKYKYKILGNNEEWNGWYGRLNSYIKFMQTLNPDTYIILCDARDVLINQDSTSFISKASNEYKDKLILSSEPNCCSRLDGPYKDNYISAKNKEMNIENALSIYINYMKSMALKKSGQDYYYSLNFGLQFGKVKDFLKVFKLMNIKPEQDDQSLVYKIFYEYPDLVELDYNNILFSNVHTAQINFSEDFSWDDVNKSWIATKTGNTPAFIQTPAKYWDAYYLLLEKLL